MNLAYELARMGGRVGLLDVDVYGPSLPILVKPDDAAVRQSPLGSSMVYPIEHRGVKLLSLGFVSPQVKKVIFFVLYVEKQKQNRGRGYLTQLMLVNLLCGGFPVFQKNKSGVPGSGNEGGATVIRGPMAGRVVAQL